MQPTTDLFKLAGYSSTKIRRRASPSPTSETFERHRKDN